MRKWIFVAAAVSAASLGACSKFLDSPTAVNDPNNPTVATRNQLFAGVQQNTFGNEEGPLPMLICEWMQQCGGVNGRFVATQGTYTINNGTFDTPFQSVYQGGGLVAIRQIEASATTDGDVLYRGIAEVYEAMDMLYAADIWGDVPYSNAIGTSATPTFDSQQAVYTALLTLLDKAIADIAGAGAGPGPADLVYQGNTAKWIAVAHQLKARIHLHQVEKLGNGEYTAALTEANLGISSSANDYKTVHAAANAQDNVWYQFQNASGFGTDLVAGAALVNIMNTQGDPRLPEYFTKNQLGTYGGYDVTTGTTPPNQISDFSGNGRRTPTFAQPIITWDENQLIKAEAGFQLGGANLVAAVAAFNAVRTAHGKAIIAVPTLTDIMTEKYIAMFQNREAWNDWKRTCLPVLHPALAKTVIPGRVFYGQTEEQTNPNTPTSASQNLNTFRNWNDPNACPP